MYLSTVLILHLIVQRIVEVIENLGPCRAVSRQANTTFSRRIRGKGLITGYSCTMKTCWMIMGTKVADISEQLIEVHPTVSLGTSRTFPVYNILQETLIYDS
jgi:hypothetical protein